MTTIIEKAKTLKTDKQITRFIDKVINTQNVSLLQVEVLLVEVGIETKRVLNLIEEWQNS